MTTVLFYERNFDFFPPWPLRPAEVDDLCLISEENLFILPVPQTMCSTPSKQN